MSQKTHKEMQWFLAETERDVKTSKRKRAREGKKEGKRELKRG